MALTQRTIISQIEILRDGTMQIRFAKQIVNGDEVKAEQYHRTVLLPGVSLDEHMKLVNTHLESMGEAPVEADEINRISRVADVEHTPEAVKAYSAKVAEAEARAEPEL